jgi:DNA polymerase family A
MGNAVTALDTETFLITNEAPVPDLVVVGASDGKDTVLLKWDDPRLEAFLHRAFAGPTTFAFSAYDLAVMAQAFPSLLRPIFAALDRGDVHDVLTRAKLLRIANGTFRGDVKQGLGEVAQALLGVGKADDEYRKRYGEFHDVPLEDWPALAREYAAKDPELTALVHYEQDQRDDDGALACEAMHVRAQWALYLCSLQGIRVDKDAVEALDRSIDRRWLDARALLVRHGLVRDKDGSKDTKKAQQLLAQVYKEKGLPIPLTDTGRVSLDALSTEGSGDPVLIAYSEYTSLVKMRGTFIANLKYWPRVRPRYDELLITGRTSASVFPIQQLPRQPGVRECLIADPGHCLISVDGDAAELVSFAQIQLDLFGESPLADCIRQGVSPHWVLAADMLGLDGADYREMAEKAKAHPEGEATKQMAKPGNFGFLGGMGAEKFVITQARAGMHYSLDKARWIRQLTFDRWGILRYLDWISAGLRGRKTGHCKHASGLVRSDLSFTQLANGWFQERTACVFKDALYDVTRAHFLDGMPGRPCAFLHDEILVSCHIKDAHEVGEFVAQAVIASSRKWCPDVPMTASPAAMLRFSKGAKSCYNNEGRLIPWDM